MIRREAGAVSIMNANVDMTIDVSQRAWNTRVGGLVGTFATALNTSSLNINGAHVGSEIYMGGSVGGGLVGRVAIHSEPSTFQNIVSIGNSSFSGSLNVIQRLNGANNSRLGGFIGLIDRSATNIGIGVVDSQMLGDINAFGIQSDAGGVIGLISGGNNRHIEISNIDMLGNISAGAGDVGVGGIIGRVQSGATAGTNLHIEAINMRGNVDRTGVQSIRHATGGIIGGIDSGNLDVFGTNRVILNLIDIEVDGRIWSGGAIPSSGNNFPGGGSIGGLVGLFASDGATVVIDNITIKEDTVILANEHGNNAGNSRYSMGGLIGVVLGTNINLTAGNIASHAILTGHTATGAPENFRRFGGTRGGGLFGSIRTADSHISIDDAVVGGELHVRNQFAGGIVGDFGALSGTGATNNILVPGNFIGNVTGTQLPGRTQALRSTLSIQNVTVDIDLFSRTRNNPFQRTFGGVIGAVVAPVGIGAELDNNVINISNVTVNSNMYFAPTMVAPIEQTPINNGRIIGAVVGDRASVNINDVRTSSMAAFTINNALGLTNVQPRNNPDTRHPRQQGVGTTTQFGYSLATFPAGVNTTFVGYNDNRDNIVNIGDHAFGVRLDVNDSASFRATSVASVGRYCFIQRPEDCGCAQCIDFPNTHIVLPTAVSSPTGVPTRPHFRFVGWTTERVPDRIDNAAGNDNAIPSGLTLYRPGDTVHGDWTEQRNLYAVWRAIPYQIIFNNWDPVPSAIPAANHGNTARNVFSVVCDFNLLAPTARTGWNFNGWWTTPSGAGTQITRVWASTVALAPNFRLTRVGDTYQLRVYARYTLPVVTFNYNGATGGNSEASRHIMFGHRHDQSAVLGNRHQVNTVALPTPVRDGYIFAGWWTQQGTAGQDNWGTRVFDDTLVTNYQNHNLYARWVAWRVYRIVSVGAGLFEVQKVDSIAGQHIILRVTPAGGVTFQQAFDAIHAHSGQNEVTIIFG